MGQNPAAFFVYKLYFAYFKQCFRFRTYNRKAQYVAITENQLAVAQAREIDPRKEETNLGQFRAMFSTDQEREIVNWKW